MSLSELQLARKNAEWLILAKNTLKAYKELRKSEQELVKELRGTVRQVTDNLKEYGERNPQFSHENDLGCVKLAKKNTKLASKVDVVKSIEIVREALKDLEDQTLDAALVKQLQDDITHNMANSEATPATAMIKFSKTKKHTGQIPALNQPQLVPRITNLLDKVPQSISVQHNDDEESDAGEEEEEYKENYVDGDEVEEDEENEANNIVMDDELEEKRNSKRKRKSEKKHQSEKKSKILESE